MLERNYDQLYLVYFYQYVPLVGMEGIVRTNVDQTAFLAVTGLMESVNLAANQDGKGNSVKRVTFY